MTAKEDSISTTIPANDCNQSDKQRRQNWIKYVIGDPYAQDDPMELSMRRKQAIIFVVGLSGLTGHFASFIYLPGLLSVANDLNTSMQAVNGSVSTYLVFMGVAPLIWASLSDFYGRKRMYLLSILIGIIASVICAVSRNVGMLIFFRAMQATGTCASLTLGAGVLADTIPVSQRGRAYGFFYLGPLLGPVTGPTIGGALCQYLGWQSTFYFIAIFGAVLFILVATFLPETLRKRKTEQDDAGRSGVKEVLKSFGPMLLMLRDPSLLLITVYITIINGCLFFLNPTITDTFQTVYGFSETKVGLMYLAFGIGLMIGSVIAGRVSDYVLQYYSKRTDGKIIPELRLRAALPSFFLIPCGFLIYGWTTENAIGIYAPVIGLFVYAFGQMSAFTPSNVYLVDSQPGRSATAVGVSNCFRWVLGAITTIFSTQALHGLGTGKLFTILAAINIVNIVFIILCMVYGERLREAYSEKVRDEHAISEKEKQEELVTNGDERVTGEIAYTLARSPSGQNTTT